MPDDTRRTEPLDLEVTVPAHTPWLDAGVWCDGITRVWICCEGGRWTANPRGGERVGAGGSRRHVAKPGYCLPGAPEGALVARVAGIVFLVAAARVPVPAGLRGQLYLSINDDVHGQYGVGFADNEGALVVRVWMDAGHASSISSNPAPPALTT